MHEAAACTIQAINRFVAKKCIYELNGSREEFQYEDFKICMNAYKEYAFNSSYDDLMLESTLKTYSFKTHPDKQKDSLTLEYTTALFRFIFLLRTSLKSNDDEDDWKKNLLRNQAIRWCKDWGQIAKDDERFQNHINDANTDTATDTKIVDNDAKKDTGKDAEKDAEKKAEEATAVCSTDVENVAGVIEKEAKVVPTHAAHKEAKEAATKAAKAATKAAKAAKVATAKAKKAAKVATAKAKKAAKVAMAKAATKPEKAATKPAKAATKDDQKKDDDKLDKCAHFHDNERKGQKRCIANSENHMETKKQKQRARCLLDGLVGAAIKECLLTILDNQCQNKNTANAYKVAVNKMIESGKVYNRYSFPPLDSTFVKEFQKLMTKMNNRTKEERACDRKVDSGNGNAALNKINNVLSENQSF